MKTRAYLKFISTTTLVILAVLPAWASSSGHEQAVEDLLEVMREFNSVLAGITDKAAAKAAEDEIEDLIRRGDAAQERLEALGPAPPEVEAELQRKYGQELDEVMAESAKQVRRIATDAALRTVANLLRRVESRSSATRGNAGVEMAAPAGESLAAEGEPRRHLELGSDENVPDWVSRYPDAEISGTFLSESGSEITGMFTFRTSDPADRVLEHYEESLGKAGLERTRRSSSAAADGGYSILTTKGGGRTVRVMATREGDTTNVVVSYSSPIDPGS